jgi:hypothetical protein
MSPFHDDHDRHAPFFLAIVAPPWFEQLLDESEV